MKEALRGYADAVLGRAEGTGALGRIGTEVSSFVDAFRSDDALRQALSDPSVPLAARRAIVSDLLDSRAEAATARLVGFAVASERPSELASTFDWLARRTRTQGDQAGGTDEAGPQPSSGRQATRERLDGYATAVFEDPSFAGPVDSGPLGDVEDELFRFARIVEGTDELRRTLTDGDLPPALRLGVVEDLLRDRALPASEELASYAVRTGRPRDLVALLDHLVERTAAERNLRIAEVRSAAELDGEQRTRLAEALGHLTGRQVELRVTLDPSLIGGLVALVGDNIVDGSIRHRLEQLRSELVSALAPDQAAPGAARQRDGAPSAESTPPPTKPTDAPPTKDQD